MADQTTATDLILEKYRAQDYFQYNRSHRFASLVGKDTFSVVQRDDSLKEDGQVVNIAFTDNLSNRNVGTGTLDGNEATFGQRSTLLKPYWHREAISIKKSEEKKAFTDQYRIQRRELKQWKMNHVYDEFIHAFEAVANDDSAFVEEGDISDADSANWTSAHSRQVSYAEATAAQRNAYLVANRDRLIFNGAEIGSAVTTMSAALLTVIATGDGLMSPETLSGAKRLARRDQWASGGTQPLRPTSMNDEKGREYFKVYVGQNSFETLYNNEDMKRYNADARVRGVEDHPLFQDGDLIYRGMIICEEPRIPVYSGVGAAGIDVEPFYFLGAQALGQAVGQKYRYTRGDNRDYQFLRKVGVEEQYSVEKLFNGTKQWGMITGYCGVEGS